jgi:hypothetical protein
MAVDNDLYEQLLAAIERRHRRKQYVLMGVVVSLGLVAAYLGWRMYKSIPVIHMSQEQAQTPHGVQIAAGQAQMPLSRPQAQEAAEKIKKASHKPPEQTIRTDGADLQQAVDTVRKKEAADFSIVTDPAKPKEKPVINAEEPVHLNVYNIKAYPKKLLEISVGAHGSDLAYLWRIDVPKVPLLIPKGAMGYAGPFIRAEYDGKVDGGIRLTIPF